MPSPFALLPVALLSSLVLLSSAAPSPPYAHLIQTIRTVDPRDLLDPLSEDITRVSTATNVHGIVAESSPLPRPTAENYTLDFCREQSHCKTERQCTWVNSTNFGPCENLAAQNEICFCFPLRRNDFLLCEKEPVCVDGEFCSQPKGVKEKLCISNTYLSHPESFPPVTAEPGDEPRPRPTPTSAAKGDDQEENSEGNGEEDEGEGDEVVAEGEGENGKKAEEEKEEGCVDARALAHLGAGELVYSSHVKARVLCDATGSCATPGHVVVFKGETMMMRRYCEKVGCENDVIDVNSPTYRKALRVASRTGGLEYTTFSARYESSIEESVIRLAVRAGL